MTDQEAAEWFRDWQVGLFRRGRGYGPTVYDLAFIGNDWQRATGKRPAGVFGPSPEVLFG